jgi:toxin ParE1/3/4
MGAVRYRVAAEDDLYDISMYTIQEWGLEQADRYISGLQEFCELISDHPFIGRECDEVYAALRRMEFESHVIFFFAEANGIRVSRVLHKSRDPFGEEFEDG